MPFLPQHTIDSTHLLAHAVTALRQGPSGVQRKQRWSKAQRGVIPYLCGSTRDQLVCCFSAARPGTATNRALAATASGDLTCAVIIIINLLAMHMYSVHSHQPYRYPC